MRYARSALAVARELRGRAAVTRWQAEATRLEAERLRERARTETFRGRRMIGRRLANLNLDDYVVRGDLADLDGL